MRDVAGWETSFLEEAWEFFDTLERTTGLSGTVKEDLVPFQECRVCGEGAVVAEDDAGWFKGFEVGAWLEVSVDKN